MRKLFGVALAVIACAVLSPAAATADGSTDSEIDISGAELSGTPGGGIDVFGTLRCTGFGQVNLDVTVEQPSPGGGLAAGANNSLGCPSAGYLLKWLVTATPTPFTFFVTGEKVSITATAVGPGTAMATDTEDHVLRWGR